MATASVLIPQDCSTDAGFRVWGKGIHDALASLGTLQQTSDTGQANWTTATRSSSPKEIWAFTDSLQSTSPVYIQFTFTYSGSAPQLKVYMGTATTGTGSLTGRWAEVRPGGNILTSTATPQQYYFSSTASRLTLWMEADYTISTAARAAVLGIERSRDAAGVETGDGMVGLYAGSNGTDMVWVSSGTVSQPAVVTDNREDFFNCCWFPREQTLIGRQITAFPLWTAGINYQIQPPILGFLLYYYADLGLGLTSSIEMYGANHTYINPNKYPTDFGIGNGSAVRLFMLYE